MSARVVTAGARLDAVAENGIGDPAADSAEQLVGGEAGSQQPRDALDERYRQDAAEQDGRQPQAEPSSARVAHRRATRFQTKNRTTAANVTIEIRAPR